jgi:hypothetical protein
MRNLETLIEEKNKMTDTDPNWNKICAEITKAQFSAVYKALARGYVNLKLPKGYRRFELCSELATKAVLDLDSDSTSWEVPSKYIAYGSAIIDLI